MLIAEARLAAAGTDAALGPGQDSGVQDGRFTWTVDVDEYRPDPGLAAKPSGVSAWQVTVTVEWPHGEQARRVDLSTVKLQDDQRWRL